MNSPKHGGLARSRNDNLGHKQTPPLAAGAEAALGACWTKLGNHDEAEMLLLSSLPVIKDAAEGSRQRDD